MLQPPPLHGTTCRRWKRVLAAVRGCVQSRKYSRYQQKKEEQSSREERRKRKREKDGWRL
jgi:hypothetical protein